MKKLTNITSTVLDLCRTKPTDVALVLPRTDAGEAIVSTLTYAELGDSIAAFGAGLEAAGFRPGDRLAVLTTVSADLFSLLLAANSRGIVCVLIDPNMGPRQMLRAISAAKVRAIVSLRTLLAKWPVLPALWGHERYCTDGAPWGCRSLDVLRKTGSGILPCTHADPDTPALVTFTSGTTGRPKGADRTFGILQAQHIAIEEELPSQPADVEMTCFPVVVFHLLACGMTAVLPPIDLRQPATAEGKPVVEEIQRWGVTRLSGAPAFIDRVLQHLETTATQCPTVRLVYVGGAPVTRELCHRLLAAFPQADCRVVYGSTEAEPIASASMREVLSAPDAGYLVGRTSPYAEVRLLRRLEQRISVDERGLAPYEVDRGAIGEIVVTGPHVVTRYWNDPSADAETKLREPSGKTWHRTGDVGRFDEQGRLWLLGRTVDLLRIENRDVHPFPVESRIGQCPGVAHVALVTVSDKSAPMVVIERQGPADEAAVRHAVAKALADLGLANLPIRFVSRLPMDSRHNSKIDRRALRRQLSR